MTDEADMRHAEQVYDTEFDNHQKTKAERDALQAKIAEDCRGCTDVADLTARLAEAVDCLADVMGYPLSDRDSMWDIVPSGTRKRADRIISREPVRNAYTLPASCAAANKDSC